MNNIKTYIKSSKNIHKWRLLILILSLINLMLFSCLPLKSNFLTAEDVPLETNKANNNFINGTMENLILYDNDIKTELTLDIFESPNWTRINILKKPGARGRHAMAPVYGTDKIVIFGGENDGGGEWGDTWVYDASENTWTEQFPNNSPSPKNYLTMAPIWGTDKVMIFGGTGFTINDTWIYDLSDNNWTRKYPKNIPNTNYGHTMASIYGTDKVLLFGGFSSTLGILLNETWIYDLNSNNWINVTKYPSPSPRSGQAMASIDNTNKVLLFGGDFYQDTPPKVL